MCNKRKIYKFLKFAEPKHQGAVWADWPEKWERKEKRCALHEVHVVNWNEKTNRNVPNQRWHCRAFVWQDLVTDASKNNICFCMKAWLFSQQHACDANEKYTVYDGQSRLSSWTPHTDCAVTACQSMHAKRQSHWWNKTSEGSTVQTSVAWSRGLRCAEKCAVLPCQYRDQLCTASSLQQHFH